MTISEKFHSLNVLVVRSHLNTIDNCISGVIFTNLFGRESFSHNFISITGYTATAAAGISAARLLATTTLVLCVISLAVVVLVRHRNGSFRCSNAHKARHPWERLGMSDDRKRDERNNPINQSWKVSLTNCRDVRSGRVTSRLNRITDPATIRDLIAEHGRWWHEIELAPGIVTPGARVPAARPKSEQIRSRTARGSPYTDGSASRAVAAAACGPIHRSWMSWIGREFR